MKKMYTKPQVETLPVTADAHVMLLPSGSGTEPGKTQQVPAHHDAKVGEKMLGL